MISRDLQKHPLEFIVLFIILLTGLISFFAFHFYPHWQRRIIYATSAAYFLWSLFFHYKKGDLDLSIIVEYLVFALLALVILTSTVF